jgi:hypothetical protein
MLLVQSRVWFSRRVNTHEIHDPFSLICRHLFVTLDFTQPEKIVCRSVLVPGMATLYCQNLRP